MWNISFSDWENAVEMFLKISPNRLNKHLQTYPFSCMDEKDKEYIASQNFFETYIASGRIIGPGKFVECERNILQKNDGSFRDVQLVTPVMYLFLIVIGNHLSKSMKESTGTSSSDAFYAGSYDSKDLYYADSYKEFTILLKEYSLSYDNYFKTDLTNFFPSINMGLLFKLISQMCPEADVRSLYIYRKLFEYIGNGRYPVVDGNPGLSYIATIFYLGGFDKRLSELLGKSEQITKYRIVRYVDDAYIFFNCDESNLPDCKRDILTRFEEVSRDFYLTPNFRKQHVSKTEHIDEDLRQRLYDYEVNDEKINYSDIYGKEQLLSLMTKLSNLDNSAMFENVKKVFTDTLNDQQYNFNYMEVLNWYLYERSKLFLDDDISKKLFKIADQKKFVFRFFTKQFTRMLVNTHDTEHIKSFLNDNFSASRNNYFSEFNVLMILEYLISTNFHHSDLLQLVELASPKIASFIQRYCKGDFLTFQESSDKYVRQADADFVENFQAFMSRSSEKNSSVLEEFAYFKNYFDRRLTYLFKSLGVEGVGRSNRLSFQYTFNCQRVVKELGILFDETDFKKDQIIDAYKLRNQNPISHASAEMLDDRQIYQSRIDQDMSALKNVLKELEERIEKRSKSGHN